MVEAAIADAQQAGFHAYMMHAQAHLERFYTTLGFTATDHRFEEAGIPHVQMVRS